jgi:hypothetical protein
MLATRVYHDRDQMKRRYLYRLDEYVIDPPVQYTILRDIKQNFIATDNDGFNSFALGETQNAAIEDLKEWFRKLISGYMLAHDKSLSASGKKLKNKLAARFKKCAETH